MDGAVARRCRELAGGNAGAVRLDHAVRLAVGAVETVAAVERAQNRRRCGLSETGLRKHHSELDACCLFAVHKVVNRIEVRR